MGVKFFDVYLDPNKDRIVRDHRISGKCIFPGAGYLELALANLEDTDDYEGLQLNKVRFNAPLEFEGGEGKSVRVEIREESRTGSFSVKSRKREGEWLEHAAGKYGRADGNPPAHVDLEKARKACTRTLEAERYYNICRSGGLEYGPCYRSISSIRFNRTEVFAEIVLQEPAADRKEEFILNPALVDGAFQAIGALTLAEKEQVLYLPFFIECLTILKPLSRRFFCCGRAKKENRPGSSVRRYELSLCNDMGEVEVEIQGFCLKAVPDARGAAAGGDASNRDGNRRYTQERPDAVRVSASPAPTPGKRTKEKAQDIILDLLSGILKLNRKELDLYTAFMDFGLDSIMVTEVVEQMENLTGIALEPALFFEYKTVDELSGYLAESYAEELEKNLRSESLSEEIPEKAVRGETDGLVRFPEARLEQGAITPEKNPEESARTAVPAQDIQVAGQMREEAFPREDTGEDIAIIGFAGRFPRSPDLDAFWDNLENGRDGIAEIPLERWDWREYYDRDDQDPLKIASKMGGFIDDIDQFDASFFNISPAEARVMDPQQRLLLETAWEVFEQAGYAGKTNNSPTGVFIGASYRYYEKEIRESAETGNMFTSLGNLAAVLSNRLSYYFGLQGPSLTIDTLCSSSLVSVITACENIRREACSMALAGGVSLPVTAEHYLGLSRMKTLSPDGRCRSFDRDANGFVSGEGVGLVLLKRLDRAIEDGDSVYAVIKGYAVNHDGQSNGLTAPNPAAHEKVIYQAYNSAQVSPGTIGYVEAHGTGTSLGDSIELAALSRAFARFGSRKAFCALGSVKTNIGHLEPASGIAGLIKIVLSMQNGKLPPSLNFNRVNPLLKMEHSPFYLQDRLADWETSGGPRRAAINTFGMSGTNAHLILQEYAGGEPSCLNTSTHPAGRREDVLTLSAKTENTLMRMVLNMKDYLAGKPELEFESICFTANTCRKHFGRRLAILCGSKEQLADKLELISLKGLKGEELEQFKIFYGGDKLSEPIAREEAAFLFPALSEEDLRSIQPSAAFFYENEPFFRDGVVSCTGLIPDATGKSVLSYFVSKPGSPGVIADKSAEAAIAFVYQYAQAKLWMDIGIQPGTFLGEGAGGYLSQVFSKSLGMGDALSIVLQGKEAGSSPGDLTRRACMGRSHPDFYKRLEPLKGCGCFVEAGLDTGLAQLVDKRTGMERQYLYIPSVRTGREGWKAFYEGLARAYSMKADIKWDAFCAGRGTRVRLPAYPFEKKRFWVGAGQEGKAEARKDTAAGPEADIQKQPVETLSKAGLAKRIGGIFLREISSSLGYVPEDISPDTPLNELGFDSIMAGKVIAVYEAELGIEIDPTILFDYNTVSRLADYLADKYSDQIRSRFVKAEEHGGNAGPSCSGEGLIKDPGRKEERGSGVFSSGAVQAGPEDGKDSRAFKGGIAVVGMAGRFPGSPELDELWENLAGSYCGTREIPKERWDIDRYYDRDLQAEGKTNCRWGCFLEDIDKFDPVFFGISVNKASLIDPQQRLMIETAWRTVEDAGYGNGLLAGSRTGVFIGVCNNEYIHRGGDNFNKINPHSASGNTFSVMANRISYLLDFHGPSLAIDTACSSSLVAVHQACRSILTGECDLALAGGVNLTLNPQTHLIFSRSQVLSPEGRCKPFDEGADGYIRGEGVGAVLLKPLHRAIADRDNIHAVIRGSAVNHGGLTSGLNTPSALAQKEVILEAYQRAGIGMDTLSLIEAHGTGTPLGDSIEIRGLSEAFLNYTARKGFCAIGTIKGNIGHLEAAAGIAGMLKVILALKNRKLPPCVNFNRPSRKMKLAGTPFYVNDRLSSWEGDTGPLRAGVNAFGFGGTNAHVILEEAPAADDRCSGEAPKHRPLLTLSAKDKNVLKEMVRNMSAFLAQNPETDINYVCATSNVGRGHFGNRIAISAVNVRELTDGLSRIQRAAAGEVGLYAGYNIKAAPGIAFLINPHAPFQTAGAAEFYLREPVYAETTDYCSGLLTGCFRKSLSAYMTQADIDGIPDNLKRVCRLAHDYAIAKVLISYGIAPDVLADTGNFITAAAVSNMLSIQAAFELLMKGILNGGASPPDIPLLMAESGRFTLEKVPGMKEWQGKGGAPVQAEQAVKWLYERHYEEVVDIGSIRSLKDLGVLTAELYTRGVNINWKGYHNGNSFRRLSLPAYAFKRKSYWLG